MMWRQDFGSCKDQIRRLRQRSPWRVLSLLGVALSWPDFLLGRGILNVDKQWQKQWWHFSTTSWSCFPLFAACSLWTRWSLLVSVIDGLNTGHGGIEPPVVQLVRRSELKWSMIEKLDVTIIIMIRDWIDILLQVPTPQSVWTIQSQRWKSVICPRRPKHLSPLQLLSTIFLCNHHLRILELTPSLIRACHHFLF